MDAGADASTSAGSAADVTGVTTSVDGDAPAGDTTEDGITRTEECETAADTTGDGESTT